MAELITAIATAITALVVFFEAVRRWRRDRRQDHLLKSADVRAVIVADDTEDPYIEIINEGPGRASAIKADMSGSPSNRPSNHQDSSLNERYTIHDFEIGDLELVKGQRWRKHFPPQEIRGWRDPIAHVTWRDGTGDHETEAKAPGSGEYV